MAPTKPRPGQFDDSRSEASSTKEKALLLPGANAALNGRVRKPLPGPSSTSSLREMTASTVTGPTSTSTVAAAAAAAAVALPDDPPVGMPWSTLESSLLHSYRHAYRLNTPSAFNDPYNQLVLSRPGIGRLSPTMARHKEERRQSKEQLTAAVRKHFNGLGVQENDVVVEFLYKMKYQDKAFRMRFTPQRSR